MNGIKIPSEFPWCNDHSTKEVWEWNANQDPPATMLAIVQLRNPKKSTYREVREWLVENANEWMAYLLVDYLIGTVDSIGYSPRQIESSEAPFVMFLVDIETLVLMKLKFGDNNA